MTSGKISSLRIFSVAWLLMAAVISPGCSTTGNKTFTTGDPGHVLVRATTGKVEVSAMGDSDFEPAQLNQKILVGQSIRTGNDSTADLFIPDVGTMRLTPSSHVHVKSLLVDKTKRPPRVNAEFELPEGRIQGNTLKMSADSSVLVVTPKGSFEIK